MAEKQWTIGTEVCIRTLGETGVILNVRHDDWGALLIDVRRDSDGERHVCREYELEEVPPVRVDVSQSRPTLEKAQDQMRTLRAQAEGYRRIVLFFQLNDVYSDPVSSLGNIQKICQEAAEKG